MVSLVGSGAATARLSGSALAATARLSEALAVLAAAARQSDTALVARAVSIIQAGRTATRARTAAGEIRLIFGIPPPGGKTAKDMHAEQTAATSSRCSAQRSRQNCYSNGGYQQPWSVAHPQATRRGNPASHRRPTPQAKASRNPFGATAEAEQSIGGERTVSAVQSNGVRTAGTIGADNERGAMTAGPVPGLMRPHGPSAAAV